MHYLRRHLRGMTRLQPGIGRCFSTPTNLSMHGNVLGGENMTPQALQTFQAWHTGVSASMHAEDTPDPEKIVKALYDRVDPKCKFYPPTYFTPWEGRDEMLVLLSCVSEVFGKTFTYGRQWLSPDGRDWALEFTADVGESNKRITGIDLVKLNEDGKMIEFVVLARPPNGVSELKNQMMIKVPPRLVKLKLKQGMSSIFG